MAEERSGFVDPPSTPEEFARALASIEVRRRHGRLGKRVAEVLSAQVKARYRAAHPATAAELPDADGDEIPEAAPKVTDA